MPRDLFGDVTDPSITLATRKWYTVPVSLALHVAIISALVIVPLMAASALPLLRDRTVYVPIEPPAAPDTPPKRPESAPRANPDAAPVEEPATIPDQPVFEPGFEPDLAAELVSGSGIIDGSAVVAPPPPVDIPSPTLPLPVRIADTMRPPARVAYVAPAYPPIALNARLQGMVIIEATIDTGGRMANARVLRTDSPLFTEAALSAVRQWTYTPTLLNGVPVSVIMTVTVQFRLQ